MRKCARNTGFTLAEAMIAMVILAFATAGVIVPFSTGATLNAEGARRTLGAKLAADKLEQLQDERDYWIGLGLTWDMLSSVLIGSDGGIVKDVDGVAFADDAYGKFDRSWTCTAVTVGGEKLYLLTVTIYYDHVEMLQMSSLMGPQ